MQAQRQRLQLSDNAAVIVNVGKSDIEGIVVVRGSVTAILGRVRIDGDQPPSIPLQLLRVQLVNREQIVDMSGRSLMGEIDTDGSFQIQAVPPGEYRLSISGLPSTAYVKSARFGNADDVLNAPLRIGAGDSGSLEIVISPAAGEILGEARDARGQLAPGARIVLFPEAGINRPELFRAVTADANGGFSIGSLPPGDYKLAAWESIEPFGFFDGELLRQANQNGRPIHVDPSSRQTATVAAW
jgi:hypothetical protein